MFCYLGKQFYVQACPTGQPRKVEIVVACLPGNLTDNPWIPVKPLNFARDLISLI